MNPSAYYTFFVASDFNIQKYPTKNKSLSWCTVLVIHFHCHSYLIFRSHCPLHCCVMTLFSLTSFRFLYLSFLLSLLEKDLYAVRQLFQIGCREWGNSLSDFCVTGCKLLWNCQKLWEVVIYLELEKYFRGCSLMTSDVTKSWTTPHWLWTAP